MMQLVSECSSESSLTCAGLIKAAKCELPCSGRVFLGKMFLF